MAGSTDRGRMVSPSSELVLASTSPYRRSLMQRLGVPFRCCAPGIDEDAFKVPGVEPRSLALRLAVAKAESVAANEPDAIVIGSDQLVAFEEEILGKPGTIGRAVEQLLRLSGRSHQLVTALAVAHRGSIETHVDITTLWVRALTREEVVRYVDADRPIDCAGSYKLEERGIMLFERIESEDHTAITGLPLIALTTILRRLGVGIP